MPGDAANDFEPYLIFENNIEGTVDAYIEELVAPAALPGLHGLLRHCADYGNEPPTQAHLRAYLRRHLLRPSAAFVGNAGRSVARIEAEKTLVEDLEGETDRLISTTSAWPSARLYAALRTFAGERHPWALQPAGRLSPRSTRARYARLWSVMMLVIFFWPFALATLVVVRLHELFESESAPALALAPDVTKGEDHFHQNHFASISVVKDGWFRRALLRVVLDLMDRAAKTSLDGKLGGLDNIHFAHWMLIDDGRRLLFLANYDGSWENYLDDFIDKAARGLTAIWSNVCGFPKARFLFFAGATDERKLKTIARLTQIPTALWYAAYFATVPTIDNNSAVRDGLATPPRGAEIDRWLQRL